MEYLKPYTQQQIVVTTLTLFFGGIFTRKLYKNEKLLNEIEREKLNIEKIKQNEIDVLKMKFLC